jgi:hypothetical protein
LNYSIIDGNVVYADDLIKAANECLSNPLPNPVAWMKKHENGVVIFSLNPAEESDFTPLYAEQPAREPLTDEQIHDLWDIANGNLHKFTRAIEAAHGITDPEQSKPQSNAI